MTIIDVLKTWFYNEKNVDIINLENVVKIPTRDYFIDDLDKLSQIDLYKEEYLKILTARKLISSIELPYDNLENEIQTSIDLVLNLHLQKDLFHEDSHNLKDTSVIVNNKLSDKIYIVKLNLYISDLYNLESIILEKLIALKELQDNDNISLNNKNILNEYINNLTNKFYIFYTQIMAIEREINIIIKAKNIDFTKETISYESGQLTNKYKSIYKIAVNYLNKITLNHIDNLNTNTYIRIGLIEKELEKYLYNHKELINEIHNKLLAIANIKNTQDNKQALLEEIKIIKDNYQVFESYGRNIVSKENWQLLYSTKFNILTCDIYKQHANAFSNIHDKLELSYYEEIIFNKINDILYDKYDYFKNYFKNDYKEAIRLISIILKDKRYKYDYHHILTSLYLLTFLMSLDNKNGLNNFFNNYIVSSGDVGKKMEKCLKFDEYIPIATVFELLGPMYEKDDIYILYKLFKKYEIQSDIYKLLEGINMINSVKYIIVEDHIYNFTDSYPYNKIRNSGRNKHIIYPHSLKQLNYDVFEGVENKGVTLNDNLEMLSNYKFRYSFEIPSSLMYIDNCEIKRDVEIVTFKNYKNSKILHDYHELAKMIDMLFMAKLSENKQRIGYSKYDRLAPYKIADTFTVYRKCVQTVITPRFNKLILKDKDRDVIIDSKNLTSTHLRINNRENNNNIYNNELYAWRLNKEEIDIVINKLVDLIYQMDNYKLEFYLNNKEKIKRIDKKGGFHNYFGK